MIEASMRYLALTAILASLTLCLGLELIAARKIEQRNAIIQQKRRELKPLAKFAAEVQDYQKKKDELQRRIDFINQLKQSQKGPSGALGMLRDLDLSRIDSVAIDGKTMTINSHADIETSAQIIEKRSANGRVSMKVKI